MKPSLTDQRKRRAQWFQATRRIVPLLLNPDGSARLPQFGPPHRETLWMAPALFQGGPGDIALANRAIARWHDAPRLPAAPGARESHGSDFGIFQSNTIAHLFHKYGDAISPAAAKVMRVHLRHAVSTFRGSGQPDTKFHGANDNMPMMATEGLVFAGEALEDARAVEHGLWNLHQFRLLLSRAAWASEYNSSTYTPVTLSAVARLARNSHTAEVRRVASEIEKRLWAEVLLHYHPETFMQAGPQSRAYVVDSAGHTHSLQILLWAVFGEGVGRNPLRSLFSPDGREVVHFEGCPYSSIAEAVHILDADFLVPGSLARLVRGRKYPARVEGRAESMRSFDTYGRTIQTKTYMTRDFTLGSADAPMGGGEQTLSLCATYRRRRQTRDFRDAGTVYCKYVTSAAGYGGTAPSLDGGWEGERFLPNQGWMRVLQKDNVALLSATPNLEDAPLSADILRLDIVFPAHYGRIRKSIIGSQERRGASGQSAQVVPVSLEAGEVYIHLFPLLPTSLPRRTALRWMSYADRYQVLQLINYEGPRREFSREKLEMTLNGVLFRIDSKRNHRSLRAFHERYSQILVTDYFFQRLRFLTVRCEDAWFDLVHGPAHATTQTEAIDGRTVEKPFFRSNQPRLPKLPFLRGAVRPNRPLFPWKNTLDVCWYPESPWIIGSRGLEKEAPYRRRYQA